MKTLRKGYFIFILILVSTLGLKAQKPYENPKYGVDSASRVTCASNISAMAEFVKINVMEYAYQPWSQSFRDCPAASKNIYINGKKILDYKIENTTDEITREAFVDTLMMLYDQRILYFGEESFVLGRKGIDLLKYRRNEVEEAYGYLLRALETGGNKTEPAVLATLITTSSIMFQTNKIEADQMIDNYLKASAVLDSQKESANTAQVKESIEKTFAESGAADCDKLIEIFTPRYESAQTDLANLKNITDILNQSKCQETDLFARASESLYAIEPSAEAGANLAMIFSTRGEYAKATEYYLKAVEQEENTEVKAGYYYQLAAISLKQKQLATTKKYAYEAINLKPDYGKAYILLANTYASSSAECGGTNFERAAVYLVAVDKLVKARTVDPSVSEEASELIGRYSQYFPNNEDAFFEGFTDGNSYTVGCYISETTTIRTLKR